MPQGLRIELRRNRCRDDGGAARLGWLPIVFGMALSMFAGCGVVRGQDLDVTRRALAGKRKNLIWENVSFSDQYICGVRPKRQLPGGIATVTLSPSESIEFLVPPDEMIRVESVDGQPIDNGLTEIWTSNGSGMFRKQTSAIVSGGCSLLSAGNESGYSIAKVCRSGASIDAVRLAIYTSARPPIQTLDYYECEIATKNRVTLSDDLGTRPRQYTSLCGGDRTGFQLPGASRVRVEARLRYDMQPERRQTYWIRVFVDGHLYRVLSLDTEPTNQHRQYVDGQERLIGRREFAYLDLDCGDKKVEIETSHDCFVRIDGVGLDLCRPNLNRSFDYPSWENLKKAVTIWDAIDFGAQDFIDDGRTFGLADRDGVSPALLNMTGDLLWDPYLNQQRMQGLARDNAIPHAGLRAYMWLRACASRHMSDVNYGDEIDIDELCQRLRNRYTMFRDAAITQLPTDSTLRRAAYVRRQVRRPGDEHTERIVGAQHLESSLSLIGQATLVDLTDDCADPLTYGFPDGLGTSVVRLIVDQTKLEKAIRVMIRMDGRPPLEFLVTPDGRVDRARLVPTTGEAALAAMVATYGKFDQSTAGGPFAMFRENVPSVTAATAEFVKPANVNQVCVWIESCDGGCVDAPIGVGLQYLDGRPSELSETSYRYLHSIADNEAGDDRSAAFARHELDNDAFELESELRDHHRVILDSVRQSPITDASEDRWDDATVETQLELIGRLTTQRNWPATIELLSDLIRHSDGQTRNQAVMSRVDALQSSGEDFLAMMELRGWMVYSNDPAFQREVFERLIAEASSDRYDRMRYLAFAAIQWSDRDAEIRLANELADGSRYRDALILLSDLESHDGTEDLLLRCSLQAQWWTTFDRALDRIKSPAKKNLWMGLKQSRLGFYDHARQTLAAAGTLGRQWLAYGQAGEQIFGQLSHTDPAVRFDAIGRWEQWQSQNPGATRWNQLSSSVRRAAGIAQTVSLTRGTRSNHFVATSDRPAEVTIQGPARIKLAVRPLHAAGIANDSINDWLHFESGGQSTLVPITSNAVSTTLRVDGQQNPVGQLVESVIDLPAGRNQFRVYCSDHHCLVQIEAERPEISLPMLPPVNSTTMDCVVQGRFGKPRHVCSRTDPGEKCQDCVRVFRRDHKCLTTPIHYLATSCRCVDHDMILAFSGPDIDPLLERLIPVDPVLVIADRDSSLDAAIAITHQSEMDARLAPANPLDRRGDPRLAGLVQLLDLSQQSESNNQSLQDRLRVGSSWELYQQFDQRAGMHSIEVDDWTPESPQVRIRKQLMPRSSSRYALAGESRLNLEINDSKPTVFEFQFNQPTVGFVPVPSATSIVETRSRSLSVACSTPNEWVSTRLDMPAGRHSIGISLADPLPNQYVLVDVYEIDESGRRMSIQHGNVRRVVDQRNYHVATADRPLVVGVSGPSVIRVDQYQDGVTRSEHHWTRGDRELTFAPPAGAEPALYRVFQLVYPSGPAMMQGAKLTDGVVTAKPDDDIESAADWADALVQAVYHKIDFPESISTVDTLALRSGDLVPLSVRFDEWADPQNRWPGTTGFGVRYRSRYAEQEFPLSATSDDFIEFKVSRLQHHRWSDHYTDTDLLARTRENGSPTIGLDHRGSKSFSVGVCDPWADAEGRGPLRLDYRGYVLGQFNLNRQVGSNASRDAWTTGFQASVSRNHYLSPEWSGRWALSTFGRSVRDNDDGYVAGAFDQDVFTRYKSDHPFGLSLTHRLLYQNNLDSRWWLSPALVSNSDQWTPDNAGLHVGTDQLFGPLQIRLSYRMTEYFADNDRSTSRLQNVVYADLQWTQEHGPGRSERRDGWGQWGFSLRSDLTNNNTTIGLSYVFYTNDGRGYRDFRPGSILFRPLRDERAARRYLFEP
ncbi:MAG: hypothetical protein KDB00_01540 [Planctomycetales bacterium]|nr:hypothetical protein [Planctomycetales bacterium]